MLLPLLFSVGLALVHLFASKLRFLDVIPRSRWLSIASGASVAYVARKSLSGFRFRSDSLQNLVSDRR